MVPEGFWIAVANQLPAIISATFGGLVLLLTWWRTGQAIDATHTNRASIDEMASKVDEYHVATNGKMDQLLKTTALAARAEGRLEGSGAAPSTLGQQPTPLTPNP